MPSSAVTVQPGKEDGQAEGCSPMQWGLRSWKNVLPPPPPPWPPQLLTVAPSKMALMILGSELLTAAPFELGNLFGELHACFQVLPACYGSVSLPGIFPLYPHS